MSFFKKIADKINISLASSDNNPDAIYESEPTPSKQKYYQDSSYYAKKVPTMSVSMDTGDHSMADVPTFSERVKDATPSAGGLYPAEILLLFYCNQYRKYPNPKNGYPGLWWFKYGIRNVDEALDSLVARGFLVIGTDGKYTATASGQQELAENEYVEYSHRKSKNIEITPWTVNKLIQSGTPNQAAIVQKMIDDANTEAQEYSESSSELVKDIDPKLYRSLRSQDKQIAAINKAGVDYKDDLDTHIKFWEDLLATDGILVNGVSWPFIIVDLYYKAKRYDDAWRVLDELVSDPLLTKKARQWQIRVLKKEKKDYTQIQRLLDKGM